MNINFKLFKSFNLLVIFFLSFSISAQTSKAELEKMLIGKHKFGVQFIWNKYGTAEITKEKGVLKIKGTQYSDDKSEYCELEGTIQIANAATFIISGDLKLFTKDCCGEIKRTGEFRFLCKNNRKFWRYQDFNEICSPTTCAYYLDIFKK